MEKNEVGANTLITNSNARPFYRARIYTLFHRGAKSPSVANVNLFGFCEGSFWRRYGPRGLACDIVESCTKVGYFATRLRLLLFSNVVSRLIIVCRGFIRFQG